MDNITPLVHFNHYMLNGQPVRIEHERNGVPRAAELFNGEAFVIDPELITRINSIDNDVRRVTFVEFQHEVDQLRGRHIRKLDA